MFLYLRVSVLAAPAADKLRIDKEADIPRFSYAIADSLETVVRDKAAFARVITPVRADIESVLAKYDIGDKAVQRQMRNSLVQLDFLAGNYDAALSGAEAVRALEEKPADKLLSGLRVRAMVAAAKQTGGINTPAYFDAVASNLRRELDSYRFEVIANDVRNFKAGAELIGEGRILGAVRDIFQATLDKTGALSSDLAPGLINARYALEIALPLKQTLIAAYTAYLNQHKVEKADIWAARGVTLPASGPYKTVNVSVWDSGVDTRLFAKQLLTGANGSPALIAFDLESRPTKGELFPIPAAIRPKLPEMLARTKGFSDSPRTSTARKAAK